MITARDLYTVLSAVIPLYVAMILAYGSVRWWKIFTPDQCSGINRFVALFAVPLLSFHFIASSNPFELNLRFLAADSLAKLIFLAVLALWLRVSKRGSLEWLITLFSLATLPNTLVMGIPLLKAMYGEYSGKLMVQIVVLQCIIWYTLLLFLFEYRAARNLIAEQFPGMAASIVSFKVDSDVMSLDGGRDMLQTEAEVGGDGKLHVKVRRSVSSRCPSVMSSHRPSFATGGGIGGAGLMSLPSLTPRPSNLTGAEIYSIHSSRNPTPRGSSFNPAEFYSMMQQPPPQNPHNSHNFGLSDLYSLNSSRGPTPRTSNFEEENPTRFLHNPTYNTPKQFSTNNSYDISMVSSPSRNAPPQTNNSLPTIMPKKVGDQSSKTTIIPKNMGDESKEMHMFVWSSSASPVSDGGGLQAFGGRDTGIIEMATSNHTSSLTSKEKQALHNMQSNTGLIEPGDEYTKEEFSFGNHNYQEKDVAPRLSKVGSNSTLQLGLKLKQDENKKDRPPATVMTKLILVMVWRKLIRNPNTYSSLLGVVWSLVSFRWDIAMPRIIKGSISILSDAGLGMAMFSLGLFMALQPKLIPCGNSVAAFGMAVRFLTGPAVMAVASIVVGLRGVLLHVAIVQAALPQGIVPFVFAKEYNVHPDILSTGVIFGMIIALPITLLYYFFLGL